MANNINDIHSVIFTGLTGCGSCLRFYAKRIQQKNFDYIIIICLNSDGARHIIQKGWIRRDDNVSLIEQKGKLYHLSLLLKCS